MPKLSKISRKSLKKNKSKNRKIKKKSKNKKGGASLSAEAVKLSAEELKAATTLVDAVTKEVEGTEPEKVLLVFDWDLTLSYCSLEEEIPRGYPNAQIPGFIYDNALGKPFQLLPIEHLKLDTTWKVQLSTFFKKLKEKNFNIKIVTANTKHNVETLCNHYDLMPRYIDKKDIISQYDLHDQTLYDYLNEKKLANKSQIKEKISKYQIIKDLSQDMDTVLFFDDSPNERTQFYEEFIKDKKENSWATDKLKYIQVNRPPRGTFGGIFDTKLNKDLAEEISRE